MATKLLCYGDLKAKGINYSKSHLFRLMKAGTFPNATKGAGSQVQWPEAEIDAYIEKLVASRTPRQGHAAA
jgi:predicted DNA-binding transcriptional regulator AlpA